MSVNWGVYYSNLMDSYVLHTMYTVYRNYMEAKLGAVNLSAVDQVKYVFNYLISPYISVNTMK